MIRWALTWNSSISIQIESSVFLPLVKDSQCTVVDDPHKMNPKAPLSMISVEESKCTVVADPR